MGEKQSKSFWTSVPGILTGVAALITAIVGLLSFYHHGSRYTRGGPSSQLVQPAQPSTNPEPSITPAAQQGSGGATETRGDRPEFRQVSQGQEILKASYTLDLDSGVIGGASADADLFWATPSTDTRYLQTYNSAELSLVGATDLSSVPNNAFLTASFAPGRLNGSPTPANQIPTGTVILVKTTAGRYAKVRIEQYGIAAPGDLPEWPKAALLIRWETFALE